MMSELSPMGMCRNCHSKKMVLDFDTITSLCGNCNTKYKVELKEMFIDGEKQMVPSWLGDEVK